MPIYEEPLPKYNPPHVDGVGDYKGHAGAGGQYTGPPSTGFPSDEFVMYFGCALIGTVVVCIGLFLAWLF